MSGRRKRIRWARKCASGIAYRYMEEFQGAEYLQEYFDTRGVQPVDQELIRQEMDSLIQRLFEDSDDGRV